MNFQVRSLPIEPGSSFYGCLAPNRFQIPCRNRFYFTWSYRRLPGQGSLVPPIDP